MKIEEKQYEQIKDCFPRHRKPAKISNLDVLNAVLYVVENGGNWRSLLKEYGDWHVIYVRVNRWAKKEVLQAAFVRLHIRAGLTLHRLFLPYWFNKCGAIYPKKHQCKRPFS